MPADRGSAEEKRWLAAVATIEYCVLCTRHGTQVAHSNRDRGMSQKARPWLCAALCPDCHGEIDNGRGMSQQDRRAAMDRAIVLTHAIMAETGVLVLGKVPKRATTGAA